MNCISWRQMLTQSTHLLLMKYITRDFDMYSHIFYSILSIVSCFFFLLCFLVFSIFGAARPYSLLYALKKLLDFLNVYLYINS